MKKSLCCALTVFLCAGLFAGGNGNPGIDEVSANSEMVTAYSCGFYPGVVRYADEILANQSSVFAGKASVYKGESLFKMGRIRDSLDVLEKCENLVKDDRLLSAKRCFWTGRGLENLEFTEAAAKYFYKAADLLKNEKGDEEKSLYSSSVYWCGKTAFALKKYKNAADCFEYVSENGNLFTNHDYEDSLVFLEQSYVLSGQNEKAVELGAQVEAAEALSPECVYSVMLFEGDALSSLKKYPESYRKYCQVLSDGPSQLAATAMQKAYAVSSEHKTEVKEEPGSIIEKAKDRLTDYPQLVSEFWTRLAIDAFNAGDYSKSINYFAAAEKDADEKLKQLKLLYTTEINFVTSKKVQKEAAEEALDSIKKGEIELAVKQDSIYAGNFTEAKVRYSGLCENWEECLSYAGKKSAGSAVSKSNDYWKTLSMYNLKKYDDALKLLEEKKYTDEEFELLRAKTLARLGRSSEADKIFYSLKEKGSLNNDGQLDYTRTLLNAGHLISTVEQASDATGDEAEYMKSLAFFNRRKWAEAEAGFSKVLKGNLEAKYQSFARFYLGYSQYQLGKYSQAYSNLSAFLSLDGTNALSFDGALTASRSAVQCGKTSDAIKMAETARRNAKNDSQKQESILLTAGIYSDAGRYDEAIAVLKPYSTGRSDFACQCKYMTAQILVQKKDYVQADTVYGLVAFEKVNAALAEEALYRRGELSYTTENWQKAIDKFDEYSKQYFGGQYFMAAHYFTADCYVKLNQSEKAVMLYEEIVNSRESSTYKYSAEKQLVDLYRAQGDYSSALSMAQKMIEDYGDQASKDGLPQLVRELKALNSGADKTLLKKENEYNAKGGIKTAEGRKAGTELAVLYGQSQENWNKAESLALSLLKEQTKESNKNESLYAAQNYQLLASIYRNSSKLDKASENFLNGAKYFRQCGKDGEAAKCLYGAAEAFDAAGKTGDAKATADSLKQLYPESQYAKDAEKLIK